MTIKQNTGRSWLWIVSRLLLFAWAISKLAGCDMMSGRPWMIECTKTCRGRVRLVTVGECQCMQELPCSEVKR